MKDVRVVAMARCGASRSCCRCNLFRFDKTDYMYSSSSWSLFWRIQAPIRAQRCPD